MTKFIDFGDLLGKYFFERKNELRKFSIKMKELILLSTYLECEVISVDISKKHKKICTPFYSR